MRENLRKTILLARTPTAIPIIWYEDCKGHVGQYATTGTGSDYSIAYDASMVHIGGLGLDIKTRATTPAVDDVVTVLKYVWIPPTQQVRIQCVHSPYTTATDWLFDLLASWYDGTNLYSAGLRLQSSDASVRYYNSAGTWAAISGWTTPNLARRWQHLDLSLDLSAHTYKRVAVSHQVTDLSAQSINSAASAILPNLTVAFQLTTKAAAQQRCYVGEALITPEAL